MVEPQSDDQVLRLRSQGNTFGTIAKTLGLDTAQDAHNAFHRAIRRRPLAEQAALLHQERARLAELSEILLTLGHLTEEQVATQIVVVEQPRGRTTDT